MPVESVPDPVETYAGLELWTWHTSNQFRGNWFGIPLANYTAWFAGLFAYTVGVRVGRDHLLAGPTKFIRGRNIMLLFFQAIAFLALLLFIVKFALL